MKRILFLTLFLVFISLLMSAQDCSLSTDCGDVIADWGLANNVTFVCEGEPFEVSVNPNTTMSDINEIVWIWGDGQTDTVSDFSNQSHTYIIDDAEACTGSQKVFSITMEIFRFCSAGSSCHFQTAPVAVRFKPRASFDYEPVICLGNVVEFESTTCNGDSFSWNFGDNITSTEEDPSHEYLNTNTYQVNLVATNECGDGEITQSIDVINTAISNIYLAESSVVIDSSATPFIMCSDNYPPNVSVLLRADTFSLNENFYEWQSLSGNSNASYSTMPPSNDATPNVPEVTVSFSDTGLYQIILEVDNECNQPDFDTLFIQVLTGEGLSALNQPDACLELSYTPDPFNPDATYTINGNVQTNFPMMLGVGTYTVSCFLQNECGDQTVTDEFEVLPAEMVAITFPTDTTLCVDTDSIMILYEPFGGTWSGQHLTFYGDSVFFHPVEIGVFDITYMKGPSGTDCFAAATITITVEDSGITTTDYEVCSWSPPFQMTVNNPGGTGTFSSTACPACIQGDTFIIAEMVALGLTEVEVMYSGSSIGGCDGGNTFTVTIDDPNADFDVEPTYCVGDLIVPDISNANGTLSWMINGQPAGSPPFNSTSFGAGNYSIELTAVAGDCDTMTMESFTIFSVPTDVSFTAAPLEGCADLEVELTNTTPPFDNEAFEWYINDSLFSNDDQPGTITLGPGFSDTTYVITLLAGNSCQGEEVTETITVFPRPVPIFGPMQNSYCSGDTVTFANVSFGGPMTSWLWDYGNGVTSTDSIPLQMIYFTDTIPTVYTISLTATNDCGTETFTYDLTVNPTDVTAFFNIDPVEGCVGVPVCLTNLSTLGAAVLWEFGDGNTSTQFNPCHTYSNSGNYTITLKAFGCGFDSIQFEVIVHPMPTASFNNNTIACPGEAIIFTNNSALAQNFLWDFGDGDTSTLNNPSHVYMTSGTYEVKLLATSTEGCADSSFATVTILVPPTASFITSTDSVCVGQNITFTSTSTPDPLTCFWDFGDGNFSNDCFSTHSYNNSGSYIVTLIVTDASNCSNTAQQLVNVAPNPIADFDFIKNGDCTPVEVVFQNQSLLGESYIWDFGDGTTSTATEPTHIYTSGGNYTITLTTTSGVCSNTTTKEIEIFQKPDIQIVTPLGQSGCAAFDAAFAVSPATNNFEMSWDFGDGSFSFDESPSHQFDFPSIYEVTVIVADTLENFCADTASIVVEVFEPVEGGVTTVDNLCFGDSEGSIDLSITNGTPNYEYDWSNGEDTSFIVNLPAGDYTFTVTDDNGCTWSETVNVLQPDAPISIEIIEEEIVTCYGGSDGAITINALGGTAGYEYLWEMGNTSTSIENVEAGDYNITITDANNCTLEEIVTIQQNDSISYDANISNISCFGFGDGQISLDNISGGVAPYFVELDTLEGTGFNGLEEGSYTLMISDANGCEQSLTANIVEPAQTWIELADDTVSLFLGESHPIISTYNVSNPIFRWTPTQWLDCVDCEDPIAQPFNDVTYAVTMTDENGCEASDTILFLVTIERGIAIPNIFTPNADGQNDVFTLLSNNPAVTEILDFKIFDRYGGILFSAQNFMPNDPLFGWDGRFKGRLVQNGHYVYQAIVQYIDGEILTKKGSVMLSR
ncbi:MAG: PKD domain-containing protein [Bacteroidota bacterium]